MLIIELKDLNINETHALNSTVSGAFHVQCEGSGRGSVLSVDHYLWAWDAQASKALSLLPRGAQVNNSNRLGTLWSDQKATMGAVQSFRELCDRQKNTNVRISLPAVCFVWQTAMIILFGVFIRYNEESSTRWVEFRRENNISSDIENDFYFRYPSKWFNLHPTCFLLFLLPSLIYESSLLLFDVYNLVAFKSFLLSLHYKLNCIIFLLIQYCRNIL